MSLLTIETVNVLEILEGKVISLRSYPPSSRYFAYQDFRKIVLEHNEALGEGVIESMNDDFFEGLNGEYSDDNGYSCCVIESLK